MLIDRRSLILTGTMGLGALALPAFAQMPTIVGKRGFTHSVASGEPSADSMLLWTRYVPATGEVVELRAEVSTSQDFSRVVGGGSQRTGPWRDHTAKITVADLMPGTKYYYRFVAPDGSMSPVGQTKTLPDDGARHFRAAIFSCSNMPYGWFNAYANAATEQFDCAIHLGDYFYEYKAGNYPAEAVADRQPEPATELIHLADYRLRYASYRGDPDLQRLHAMMPMIVQWDDHESANDSWEGGAQNHQADEGSWSERKAAAIQAYREWVPVSDDPWKAYDIGTLATLLRTETRLLGRTEQPDLAPLFRNADQQRALAAFRDSTWLDPAATMMGSQQEYWLNHGMRASVKQGQRWQIVGFGTIMGHTIMPSDAEKWLASDADVRARTYALNGIAAAKAGLPFNFDNWGGYPAARSRFLRSAQEAEANLVVISGDSHNAWAYDLAEGKHPAGVEFAGHSVTSPGFESAIGRTDPRTVASAFVRENPELKWCDVSNRGYMAMTITPDTVTNDWIAVPDVRKKSAAARSIFQTSVQHGRRTMA